MPILAPCCQGSAKPITRSSRAAAPRLLNSTPATVCDAGFSMEKATWARCGLNSRALRRSAKANPAFAAKVPVKVLEEHQARLQEWQVKEAQIAASLANLAA